MPIPKTYANLGQLRMRQGLDATTTADDGKLLAKLRTASAEIDRYTVRDFNPLLEARTFDWEGNAYLSFRAFDLLTLTSLVDGTGNTKAVDALIMQGGKFSNATLTGPWYGVRIDTTKDFLLYNVTPFRSQIVTGVWGFNSDYANAWHTSGVSLGAAVTTTSATTITTTLNDYTIYDSWGQNYPTSATGGTVQPGHLIQIDSEWMTVFRAPTTTSLTVIRGVNGTTAATHTNGTAISIYEVEKDIQDACLRLAAFLYMQDSMDFSRVAIDAFGRTQKAAGVPPDICELLDIYMKRRVS